MAAWRLPTQRVQDGSIKEKGGGGGAVFCCMLLLSRRGRAERERRSMPWTCMLEASRLLEKNSCWKSEIWQAVLPSSSILLLSSVLCCKKRPVLTLHRAVDRMAWIVWVVASSTRIPFERKRSSQCCSPDLQGLGGDFDVLRPGHHDGYGTVSA
ncbi:unnamed protein product [Ectocarpus sp. 4 AP-2014]